MSNEAQNMTEQAPAPNIMKCRDDHTPVFLDRVDGDQVRLKLRDGAECSWANPGDEIGPDKLRPRIEPWLTALCQSEHLSLLLGSGLTHAVHRLATDKSLPGMQDADFGNYHKAIEAEAQRSAKIMGRQRGNIEDQIRVAGELLRGLQVISATNEKVRPGTEALREQIDIVLSNFAASILVGEAGIASVDAAKREHAFNYLVSFLMSFASRSGTRERLHLFTTNYDRLIEAGAEAAGMHLLDRFVGTLAPIFRSSRLDLDMHYNPPGIRGEPRYLEGVARFTKLHGSLDWVDVDRHIRRIGIPFGASDLKPYLLDAGVADDGAMRLMIYPNSAKDRETATYPYVELFRDLAAAICRPNHTLIAFGYSFGDDHINRVIEDMLSIPSTHLMVISYDDPLGRIMHTYERMGRHAQVSLLIGDHVGAFATLVDHYLPKPAIDRTTFRMAELLKARWGTEKAPVGDHRAGGGDETGESS